MTHAINKIVIAGGGTAGWITAGLLARHYHPLSRSGIRIVVIESSDIAIVGVGEGTWPTMRKTLQKIGIAERDLIQHCHATFKQGSQFHNWKSERQPHQYTHPFNAPLQAQPELSAYWCQDPTSVFADSLDVQRQLGQQGLAPKQAGMPDYAGLLNYGYHMDAGVIAELIKQHCIDKLQVQHRIGTITQVHRSSNGDIASLELDTTVTAAEATPSNVISGDLFIDCTGFSALLIGKTLGVKLKPQDGTLFADRALAVQVPHPRIDTPINCFTQATAQQAGWIWDIGLSHRRGIGYVYSSNHIDREQAEQELATYVGPQYSQLSVRELNINSGYRKQFWQGNCVAVGLSAGFIEPLEASALMLIELSANMICERLPATRSAMTTVARQFNESFNTRWERIVDFLKLHYVLSERESDFWRDNRHPSSIPDRLQELLQLWQHHVPSGYDFDTSNEVFSWASYQYVLYGMDFQTDVIPERLVHASIYQKTQRARQQKLTALQQQLSNHRQVLEAIASDE